MRQVGGDAALDESTVVGRPHFAQTLRSAQGLQEIGELDKVLAWLTLSGFVNADPGYPQTTLVMNPVSELLLDLYGSECGNHARIAPGVVAIPFNLPVVISAELEISN